MDYHAKGSPVPENRDSLEPEEDDFNGIIAVRPYRENGPSVSFDYSRYEALLTDMDISAEDKLAVTQALWSIVTQFVQLGFGVHPVQQAIEAKAEKRAACGQVKSEGGSTITHMIISKKGGHYE